ncbi:YebC/PmpR family DNA-binding transcriptional regulator [Lutispora sp.]|uniref:YebC/PmpR family DNA-binding transcriptional regulator n=1 Tax=Lutispora sp. TaxID=2828727 RepID=UPI000EE9F1BD|nr:YebC/PmpR family DNA-binding transcriptional regulator [Lutispora sp.]MEA4963526.1 YebC/PmpR family DNA-binding transcriptional regulator [Lutispora sp.]HCJ56187.1 YebC/PmpR family DNA-binding transcriptional regulator [Clostridiaceae bacterium]
MSGHSKWANIKHKKGKADAARGKIFTKLGKEISIAAKAGADPDSNGKLRDVIAKAKSCNMPNDTINRAIKRGSGELGDVNYEEIIYEGYASGGVAVIVNTLTENRNRTAGDVRHIFDKNGGSMGNAGCVGWMFDKKGLIIVERSDSIDEEELMMKALEAGAEDFSAEEDSYEIITDPAAFSDVRLQLEKEGVPMVSAEVTMIPQNIVSVTDAEDAKKINKMLDMFDDNDDVQDVYHNAELPDEE